MYFLLKKQVTKLHQRPACFDASISSSYESILQEESFKKATPEIRLVFASTQISTIICTLNNAICVLPKVIETKHVENIIIWKYTNIQTCKCVLTEGRNLTEIPLVSVQNQYFYLLFSINKLNYSKAKKNIKSRDTVHQI